MSDDTFERGERIEVTLCGEGWEAQADVERIGSGRTHWASHVRAAGCSRFVGAKAITRSVEGETQCVKRILERYG